MTIELMRVFIDGGFRVGLVDDSGRKWTKVLTISDTGLVVTKVAKNEVRHMRTVQERRKLSTVINKFRSVGRRAGMTKAAKAFLTKAKAAAI